MKLCFIRSKAEDSFGNAEYELIFTKRIDDVEGDQWHTAWPEPPDSEYVDMIIHIKTKNLELNTFEDEHTYAWPEHIDRIHAIAWEDGDYVVNQDNRVVLHFGDDVLDTLHQLYKAGTTYTIKLFM